MDENSVSEHPARHLQWEGCYNVRDLGGLPTAGGGQTRWRAFIRTDLLGRLTPMGRRSLLDYGVRTIIDLRSPEQVAEEPSAFTAEAAAQQGLHYLNLPLEAYYPHVGVLIRQAQSRAEVYCITLDHYLENFAAVLRAMIQAQAGGVVIHCHAGKDRTGIIAGLLLALAGVPDEFIGEDYAISQQRLWPLYEQMVVAAGGEDKVGFWTKPTATAEMIYTMLAHLRSKYSSVREYLATIGLGDDEVAQLRQRLCAA